MQRALILQPGNLIGAEDIFIDDTSAQDFGGQSLNDVTAGESSPQTGNPFIGQTDEASNGIGSAGLSDLPERSASIDTHTSASEDKPCNLENNLKNKEFEIIIDVLRQQRGSRSKTAEQLGISARTLRYKLAKMRDSGIDVHAQLLSA